MKSTVVFFKPVSVMVALILLTWVDCSASGISGQADGFQRHQVRIGCGDMFFETMIWHNQVHKLYPDIRECDSMPEKRNYRYLPHLSAEYSYHILPWLSVGGILDFQETLWSTEFYDKRDRMESSTKDNFYNLCVMPVVRFNYFRREHVGIYSSLAVGVDINGGTEKNGFGQNTVIGAALELRPIGVTFGGGQWWGYFELGCINGMKNKNAMFMLASEILKAGISIKF